MDPITLTPIGVLHTPFADPVGMPVQTVGAAGIAGWIDLEPAYAAGLDGVAEFDFLNLIYYLHRQARVSLTVTPFMDDQTHGVFATRAPLRPNAIGLSIVRLVRVEGLRLDIEDVDMLDGTPLLDIKPYVPVYDVRATDRIGWYASKISQVYQFRSDSRFT
jgi:tRNA-Thr(GGU) m(6)t(6)A37 methyltransferase TsaA